MDLLSAYSSDDSSSETKNQPQQDENKKKKPCFSTVVSIQNSEMDTFQRNVPHIRGNWSGHVFSDLKQNQDDCLYEYAEESIERFRCTLQRLGWSGNVISHLRSGLHISFTRPFFLQLASVESFQNDLKEVLLHERASSLSVEKEIVLTNEEGTRSFFGWKLSENQWLQAITSHVDSVMLKYKQCKYYDPPIFHVSLASVNGAVPDNMQNCLDSLEDCLVLDLSLKIQQIHCTFGTTKRDSFKLL